MDTFLTLLLGVGLRVAVPALLTALLVGWLRRLDARWQAEAERARAEAPVAATAPVGAPCWETRPCSEEQRALCPAYQQAGTPCWHIKRQSTGYLPEQCLECTVFRNAPIPAPAYSGIH